MPKIKTSKQNRVAIFIDHTNVYHRLIDMKKIDKSWVTWYNPEILAKKLVGDRELVGIYFYCSPPPAYLLQESEKSKNSYWKQMSYYEEIKKLDKVEVKYGRITGVKGDLHEKNLDTQLNTDLLVQASQNKYDTAMLVSNDGDYESAIQGVKDLGRKIELAFFKYKVSWNLKRISDVSRKMRLSYFEELQFEAKKQGT